MLILGSSAAYAGDTSVVEDGLDPSIQVASEDELALQDGLEKIENQDTVAPNEDEREITIAAEATDPSIATSASERDKEKAVAKIPSGYAAGWQLIDESWYYFDKNGQAKTGWLYVGKKWYYLDPETAIMKTGFYQVKGVNYASFPSGAMAQNQWIKLGQDWYYATDSGALFAGWKKLGGVWYYLDPAENAKMKTGLFNDGKANYITSSSGAMQANKWVKLGTDWYYATGSGALKTGWIKSSGKWYWLQAEKQGLMASGQWINDGKADYFITESGAMFTGWLNQGSANGLANGMAFDIKKMIDIALAEVGYKEKASDSQLDNKTANAGSKNFTKYGRDMHAIDPGTMEYADAWCDAFVDWCFVQAYGVENARGLLGGAFNDYTPYSAQLFKDQMSWYTSGPKVGDQVFFQNSERINHTGIIYAVSNGKIYTIEGNSSNMVAKREYVISTSSVRIAGYGRPLYNNMDDNGKFVAAKEWCFLGASGARASGWVKDSGNWYYFDPATGLMQRGKKVIGGVTYSFATNGVMKTGWALENSKWYYYSSSGAMQVNAWIGDYYVGSDGVMATNKWIGDRYVDASGKYDPTMMK